MIARSRKLLGKGNDLCWRGGMMSKGVFVNDWKGFCFSSEKQPEGKGDGQPEINGQNPENQSKKIKITFMDNSKLRRSLQKGKKLNYLENYLNRVGSFNRIQESWKILKMKKMNKLLQLSQVYKRPTFKNKVASFYNKRNPYMLYMILAFNALLGLYFNWSKFPEIQEKKSVKVVANEQVYEKVLQKMQKMKKVVITSKKKIKAKKPKQEIKQEEEEEKLYNSKKAKVKLAIYDELWTQYRIVMTDEDDKQYILDPYFGDPNNILRALEKAQVGRYKNNRAEVFFDNQQRYSMTQAMEDALGFFTPFIAVMITLYIFKKSDPTSMLKNLGQGKKNFKIQSMKDIKTKFKDVAGMEQAKKEITQFVDFLKNSDKYRQMGAKIPKGALLTGPPGTGKTMLARACAGEAEVSFFYISGSEFVEIFVGLGASKVRDLFAKARAEAPSIIFIDEIDAIGKKRETSRNQEKDSTLNQLLVQMDGFSSNETVIVLAASNRKETLDSALTRPGRFDRMVEINLPDVQARQQIYMVHLAPLKIDPSYEMKVIAKRLAELSPGFSGADIANLCNEAAIIATRKNRPFIVQKDFEQAAERITAGYVKKNLMNEKTRKRVAYHEAGHAVAGWFLKGGDPLLKLTIIPRSKGALGYAQYLPKSAYIIARDAMIDKVAVMLGGITSQQIFFGAMSSGGSDDLQKVYDLTRKMVTQFGMGKETYNVTLDEQSYVQKQSIYLSDMMDKEISQILDEAKIRSRQIIEQKREIIENLALQLIEKQTLNEADIKRIMGDRPDFGENEEQPEPVVKVA